MNDLITKEVLLQTLKEHPQLLLQLYPEHAKMLLGDDVNKSASYAGYPQMADPYLAPSYKHGTVASLSNQMAGPLNETAFFVDCALAAPIINTTIFPISSVINLLPVYPSIDTDKKQGYITSIDDGFTGTPPDNVCDESEVINDAIEACKLNVSFGRRSLQSKTGEIDDLVRRACAGVYNHFYFVGDAGYSQRRGISDLTSGKLQMSDRDLILAGAVRKTLSTIGRAFQKWLMKTVWTGNATVGTAGGGFREFWGFLELIRDDYDTAALPLETNTGTQVTCAALNSCVIDFGLECLCVGNTSIYETMQEAEAGIYEKADLMGLLPFTGVIVMPHIHWAELVKCLPCEMVSNGCATPGVTGVDRVIDLAVINGADLDARQRLIATKQITLNGRTYDVFLDSSLPITEVAPGVSTPFEYISSIVFIPLTVLGGEAVAWIEHLDYMQIAQRLQPITNNVMGMLGWTDEGRYHCAVDVIKRCFEIDVKIEPRLCFTAPHLAWKIDNIKACTTKRRVSALVNP